LNFWGDHIDVSHIFRIFALYMHWDEETSMISWTMIKQFANPSVPDPVQANIETSCIRSTCHVRYGIPSSHHMRKMSTIGLNARWHFLTFFQNSWEFLVQILHVYYTFLSTLEYKFLFNYLQLQRSYAILSATTWRAFWPMDIFSI